MVNALYLLAKGAKCKPVIILKDLKIQTKSNLKLSAFSNDATCLTDPNPPTMPDGAVRVVGALQVLIVYLDVDLNILFASTSLCYISLDVEI